MRNRTVARRKIACAPIGELGWRLLGCFAVVAGANACSGQSCGAGRPCDGDVTPNPRDRSSTGGDATEGGIASGGSPNDTAGSIASGGSPTGSGASTGGAAPAIGETTRSGTGGAPETTSPTGADAGSAGGSGAAAPDPPIVAETPPAPCDTDHVDCDGNPSNGCETDISSDPTNCGACGHQCSENGATATACVSGVCKPTCASDTGDCETPPATKPDDGCETSLTSSTTDCGQCGRDCQGGWCNEAMCIGAVLYSDDGAPVGHFTVDRSYVHFITWAASGVETIRRVTISGKQLTTIETGAANSQPLSMVSDGTYVYWFDYGSPSGGIHRVTSGEADITDVVTGVNPVAIAADGTYVYWLDSTDGTLHQVLRDGTGAKSISAAFTNPNSLTVDRAAAYVGFGNGSTPGIERVPTTGTGPVVETFTGGDGGSLYPLAIAEDASHVYMAAAQNSMASIVAFTKALTGKPTVVATNVLSEQMATDGKYLYFLESDGIYRVSNTGGASTFVARPLDSNDSINFLFATPAALYWTEMQADTSDNADMILAKLVLFDD